MSKRTQSLREWREGKKKWTQERLAGALGVTQGTVSRWESGKDTPNGSARLLLKALGFVWWEGAGGE